MRVNRIKPAMLYYFQFKDKLGNKLQNAFANTYTTPTLEKFISQYTRFFHDDLTKKLAREFLLYGFIRTTGEKFKYWSEEYVGPIASKGGKFDINNGIFALADFSGEVYIRPCTFYEAIEQTLLELDYKPESTFVPHSNGDYFIDKKKEALFSGLKELSWFIINTKLSYPSRSKHLPKIIIKNTLLIPGKEEERIILE